MLVVGNRLDLGSLRRAKTSDDVSRLSQSRTAGHGAGARALRPVHIHHHQPPPFELHGYKAAAFCSVEVLRGGGDDRHGDAGCRALSHSSRAPFDIPRLPALGPRSAAPALDIPRIRDPPTRTKTSSCGARVRMSSRVVFGVVLVAGQRASPAITGGHHHPSARSLRRQIERADGTGTSKMVESLVGCKGLDCNVISNVVSDDRHPVSQGRPCSRARLSHTLTTRSKAYCDVVARVRVGREWSMVGTRRDAGVGPTSTPAEIVVRCGNKALCLPFIAGIHAVPRMKLEAPGFGHKGLRPPATDSRPVLLRACVMNNARWPYNCQWRMNTNRRRPAADEETRRPSWWGAAMCAYTAGSK
ncbi:hypothetical protein D9611_001022 [Ephemerocybe angulata]|uniref:Uncharacterized protein n=1 Tax=Ephemerocybe angulata TaxID=980116 RepID=A0A8H5BQI0_9AGAR|nr:hypothetical protein D9611_001022 [Tulosesus angulatus]